MNNKKAQASHEREILERVRIFVRIGNLDYFYGFSQADIARLRSMLLNLTQNTETTFPDFYGLTHCVELFRVSSSKESEKGSEQKRQDGDLAATINQDDEHAAQSGNQHPRVYVREHPTHSYDNLAENMRRQLAKHCKSKAHTAHDYDTTIFVIELPEADLECMLWPAENVNIEGLRIGDLQPKYTGKELSGLYRLSRDKSILEWMRQFSSEVDFVFFVTPYVIEAINLHHISEITAFLPWRLNVYRKPSFTVASSAPVELRKTE